MIVVCTCGKHFGSLNEFNTHRAIVIDEWYGGGNKARLDVDSPANRASSPPERQMWLRTIIEEHRVHECSIDSRTVIGVGGSARWPEVGG